MTLAYLDFQIEVTEAAAPRYRIAVRSQAGDTHTEIDFPFTDAQLQVELQRLEHAILYARLGTRGRLTPHEEAVRDFGLRFFDFLLPAGDARSLYYECRRVAEFEGKGVRVKLLMHAPQLAAMPWEFLFDPRRRDYLALDPYTPIVRYPELAQRTTPLPVTPPLRILGVIANPTDLPRLDVERERQQVEVAIRPLVDQGRVQLTWLSGQSWRDLQQWMRPGYGPWHIFHFIGHGEFDQRRDEGRLFLADEQGKAQAISATQLNRLLAFQRGTLRLALLNACEGARGGKFDVLSSTAATLVLGGLPAVLAMQYAITDTVALEFARTFYSALADNLPVDAAVADARNAINLHDEYSLEWGTPVLFMRTADGQLFTMEAAQDKKIGRQEDKKTEGQEAVVNTTLNRSIEPPHESRITNYESRPAPPKPGDKRTISAAGVDFTFVYVPAGPFIMGSEQYDDEKPIHTFQTDAFWLLQTPVTNAHYRPFVEGGGYTKQELWTPTGWQWRAKEKLTEPRFWQDNEWNKAKQPVVGVSWYEALAYINWLAQTTGEPIRLPTEAEWEKGARGENGLKYPWGDQSPTEELCNFGGKVGKTTPVDLYPKGASPYGALDMAGNVWEWTATKWLENYENYATLVDNNPEVDASARRVVRGGPWGNYQSIVRAADRIRYLPDFRDDNLGFRVVVAVALPRRERRRF
ncbi:MAG: CHAT domain-containing protein [Caldilinea sp. CFX5]|nr:CHAT domain-containing protein [Caldilinea sp. CFX5]